MATYIKKTETFDAVQWQPGSSNTSVVELKGGTGFIKTTTGRLLVHAGDWIVTTQAGIISVLSDADFHAQYELA